MAKIKIEFTEDHISLIRALRFEKLQQKFYVLPRHEDIEIEDVGNAKFFNVFDKKHIDLIAPVEVRTAADFGEEIYGIDTYNLWGGTYIFEDMAYILGKTDKMIEGTSESPNGPQFDEETTNYFIELANFIVDNLQNIEEIVHQFCMTGIQAGVTYECNPNEHIWHLAEKK